MRKRKFHITLFSALVLVVIIGFCLGLWPHSKNSLFDSNVQTTLYAETLAGVSPVLKADRFFDEKEYDDLTKFTFDLSGCDWNKPGVYSVPVFYDGKKTNCTVSLRVNDLSPTLPSDKENESTALKEAK